MIPGPGFSPSPGPSWAVLKEMDRSGSDTDSDDLPPIPILRKRRSSATPLAPARKKRLLNGSKKKENVKGPIRDAPKASGSSKQPLSQLRKSLLTPDGPEIISLSSDSDGERVTSTSRNGKKHLQAPSSSADVIVIDDSDEEISQNRPSLPRNAASSSSGNASASRSALLPFKTSIPKEQGAQVIDLSISDSESDAERSPERHSEPAGSVSGDALLGEEHLQPLQPLSSSTPIKQSPTRSTFEGNSPSQSDNHSPPLAGNKPSSPPKSSPARVRGCIYPRSFFRNALGARNTSNSGEGNSSRSLVPDSQVTSPVQSPILRSSHFSPQAKGSVPRSAHTTSPSISPPPRIARQPALQVPRSLEDAINTAAKLNATLAPRPAPQGLKSLQDAINVATELNASPTPPSSPQGLQRLEDTVNLATTNSPPIPVPRSSSPPPSSQEPIREESNDMPITDDETTSSEELEMTREAIEIFSEILSDARIHDKDDEQHELLIKADPTVLATPPKIFETSVSLGEVGQQDQTLIVSPAHPVDTRNLRALSNVGKKLRAVAASTRSGSQTSTFESTTVLDSTLESISAIGSKLESTAIIDSTPEITTVVDSMSESTSVIDSTPESTTVIGSTPESTTVTYTTPESTAVMDSPLNSEGSSPSFMAKPRLPAIDTQDADSSDGKEPSSPSDTPSIDDEMDLGHPDPTANDGRRRPFLRKSVARKTIYKTNPRMSVSGDEADYLELLHSTITPETERLALDDAPIDPVDVTVAPSVTNARYLSQRSSRSSRRSASSTDSTVFREGTSPDAYALDRYPASDEETLCGVPVMTWKSVLKSCRKNVVPSYFRAENLPHHLHDIVNTMDAHYRNSDMTRALFEATIEENTANDEPDAPPIQVLNEIDEEACPPWEFYYTNHMWHHGNVPPPDVKNLVGCDCKGGCDPKSKSCACLRRMKKWKWTNGFLFNDRGRLKEPGYPIFECNQFCGCGEECLNRVVQKGRTCAVNIVKTEKKGWGVFAGNKKIPKGTFIGIYSGELISESESDQRGVYYNKFGRTYLFDLDFHFLKTEDPEWSARYVVDAYHAGNLTRFLNHSCAPNCEIQACYINEANIEKPLLAVFTSDDVLPGEELCFSYTGVDDDDDDEEQDPGSSPKAAKTDAVYKPCCCGARNCRGVMWK